MNQPTLRKHHTTLKRHVETPQVSRPKLGEYCPDSRFQARGVALCSLCVCVMMHDSEALDKACMSIYIHEETH